MNWKWLGGFVVCGLAVALGCSSGQQLESISVTPATVTFGAADPALKAQLTATGTYSHPPATKNITDQVTWTSDITQVAQVTSAGSVSPAGTNCGLAGITASLQTNMPTGNVVSGTMNVTVTCLFPTLTVALAGAGSGTVTSVPAGINCPNVCAATFAGGTSITLTATPLGNSSFGSWNGCNSSSGETCTLLLDVPTTVTATFN